MKKPWRELNSAKRIWNTSEAEETVSAANSHVSPKRNITPVILISRRIAVAVVICSLVLSEVFLKCRISTITTATKMTMLKRRMAKMGPRKAPKNTPVLPMKQLEGTN